MQKSLITSFMNYLLTLISIFFCILAVIPNSKNFAILFASIYLITISCVDAISSKIPNILTLIFFVIGLVLNVASGGWWGVWFVMTGASTGLALMILPFLLGGMGAGDVKALVALGALMGPKEILQIFLYMGIIGGIIGLIYFTTSGRLRFFLSYLGQRFKEFIFFKDIQVFKAGKGESGIRFPYAIAIAFGFSIYVLRGAIF